MENVSIKGYVGSLVVRNSGGAVLFYGQAKTANGFTSTGPWQSALFNIAFNVEDHHLFKGIEKSSAPTIFQRLILDVYMKCTMPCS